MLYVLFPLCALKRNSITLKQSAFDSSITNALEFKNEVVRIKWEKTNDKRNKSKPKRIKILLYGYRLNYWDFNIALF